MFNLMSNCCSWVSKIQEPIRKVTVLMVGLDKAGKTSSIRAMLGVQHPVETGPTGGCVRTQLRMENFVVTLLDVGGSAESRGTWRNLYAEAHAVIFVVDSSDRQRIREVREVLADLLKEPLVAGKPLLVLANKQDKVNALPGSELIELLSLEKLVNQSRSMCHIESYSALMDLRRWSDRKALRGLRWLLHTVYQDFPELCTRVGQDCKIPLETRERQKTRKTEKAKTEKCHRKISLRPGESDPCKIHQPKDNEKKTKTEKRLQPIRNMLPKESAIKKLKTKKKKDPSVTVKKSKHEKNRTHEQKDDDDADGDKKEQENCGDKKKTGNTRHPTAKTRDKNKPKVKKDDEENSDSTNKNQETIKDKEEKRRKKNKLVKVKRKNKINTEEMCRDYTQPVDLSETFDLYRKAILALKERQDQRQ
ncbi:ADP-ribosylation factor-like protein 13A isoform X2 [Cynoglossus semilaevis]|uniref:ADP-ribosylation factor-like 13A n=1 Tax=Cynoglossus semilaevis TaxID=244447 RepID=A0A3P8UL07_CYNSE|nr:ADP-ribosylation factor-like protein 13B isoform X2 [Cynoglossus semilaevis]